MNTSFAPMVPVYSVTKKHTYGLLSGLVTTEQTTVKFPVPFICKKAIGGGSYEVTACVQIGMKKLF